ncbi:DUF6978 family protein [Amycolatopsis sp. cmx-4-61]|uniref:DUF6978 family protein n=1 Tax=Amycolatopsis sp. cmx-4-61 TaxID=2790937 RepID=UPI003979240B
MLEQWEADHLLRLPKVYSLSTQVDMAQGADNDYQIESEDGSEHFLLDVRRPLRNKRKVRFQLRYRRDIVLARLCTAVPHGNPDGEQIGFPHLHIYREGYDDKWAEELPEVSDIMSAMDRFCKTINLPSPDIQGGLI